MGVLLAPIVKGKLEAWKAWTREMMGPRAAEFKEFNKRHGLTPHAAWLVETPTGFDGGRISLPPWTSANEAAGKLEQGNHCRTKIPNLDRA